MSIYDPAEEQREIALLKAKLAEAQANLKFKQIDYDAFFRMKTKLEALEAQTQQTLDALAAYTKAVETILVAAGIKLPWVETAKVRIVMDTRRPSPFSMDQADGSGE